MASIRISVCEIYRKEIERVLVRNHVRNAELVIWPCDCTRCSSLGIHIERNIGASAPGGDLGQDHERKEALACENQRDGAAPMCQQLIAQGEFLDVFTRKGFYIASSGWMVNWRTHVTNLWGCPPDMDKSFYRDIMPRVLLLDTQVYEDVDQYVKDFESKTGVEVDTIPIGIGQAEKNVMLKVEHINARALSSEMNALTQQVAQQQMLLDFFPRLSSADSVDRVIVSALETLVEMTGAQVAGFRSWSSGHTSGALYAKTSIPSVRLERVPDHINDMKALKNHAEGVGLRVITYHEEVYGLLDLDEFLFEQYRASYEELIHSVVDVFALALANADHNQKLTLARNQLLQEFESRKKLFAYITHELRTPLNGISGYLQLMGHHDPSRELKTYIDNALAATRTLLALVNDLLNQAQMEAGKLTIRPAPFSLKDLVNHVVSMIQPAIEVKGLSLRVLMKGHSVGEFMGDELRIGQILINLLANAVKFMQKGTLRFTVSVIENDAHCALLSFHVEDTAGGMSQELLERLFQPFSQADGASGAKGTGLGLSISMELANQMSGVLSATTREGVGSLFSFHIVLDCHGEAGLSTTTPLDAFHSDGPQSQTPELRVSNGGSSAKRDTGLSLPMMQRSENVTGSGSGFRILVVDDDSASRLLLSASLEKHGYTCDVAHHGEEAVEKAKDTSYNIIFMDCQMPIMDGLTATQRIVDYHGNTVRPAIYAVTSYDLPHEREKCLGVGMVEVISKPIDIKKILQVVGQSASMQ